jgi:glc operon protein GlcG
LSITNGDLVLFVKMDSTQLLSTTVAHAKARTAVRYRRPSIVFFRAMETGHPYVATLDPTLVASGGGNLLILKIYDCAHGGETHASRVICSYNFR